MRRIHEIVSTRQAGWVVTLLMIVLSVDASAATVPSSQPAPPSLNLIGKTRTIIPEVTFQATPLSNALDFVAKIAGFCIAIDWRSLDALGIKPNTPITLNAHSVPIVKLVSLVLKSIKPTNSHPSFVGVSDLLVISSPTGLQRIRRDTQAIEDLAAKSKIAPLDKHIPETRFDANQLADVIDFLYNISNLKLNVDWDALAKAGIKKDTKISLHLKDVSLGQVLVLIMDTASDQTTDVQYNWDGSALNITASKH